MGDIAMDLVATADVEVTPVESEICKSDPFVAPAGTGCFRIEPVLSDVDFKSGQWILVAVRSTSKQGTGWAAASCLRAEAGTDDHPAFSVSFPDSKELLDCANMQAVAINLDALFDGAKVVPMGIRVCTAESPDKLPASREVPK